MKLKNVIGTLIVTMMVMAASVSHAFVLGPTTPGKWGPGPMGTGATVTYSFQNSGSCAVEFAGCSIVGLNTFMPVGFVAEITAALNAWSAVANLTFVEVADNGTAFNANCGGGCGDIRFGGHAFDGPSGVLAHGFYPPNNGNSAAGDIHYDIADLWKIGTGGAGVNIFQVTAHELGHALGLAHTAFPNSLMNPFYTEAFLGPQADDIAGMQFIYGAPVVGVSEPGSIALLGLGLVMAFAARRRRKQ